MYTNVTQVPYARCHPYSIPQPVKVGHTTYDPYSFRIVMWVLLRPTRTVKSVKVLWDGTYGFSFLFEKTRKSNHLQSSLQRQHFLLSYLKTLSVGPVGVRTRGLPLGDRCSPNWANQVQLFFKFITDRFRVAVLLYSIVIGNRWRQSVVKTRK